MNNITTTISFSIFSNKGVYALLLGSGISKNSGIPTGWDIVVDLIQKLAELKKEKAIPSPEEWFKLKYDEEPNYSNILAKLVKSPSERVNFLKLYFEPTEDEIEQGLKLPTKTHKNIASLIKKGYIKVVITTNFDRLLEKALQAEGIEPIIIRHPNDIDGAMPLVHSDFVLIKINGDYLDTRFLNTEEELSTYDKKLQDYILRIINEFGIVSSGWSAKWDLGLLNVLRQSENFRFSSYWTHIGKCESELNEIAKNRKGETIKINDSDSFFEELTDKILALEHINDNHPLTSDIAVARLKRYIVKDEYKILLHDLFQNQLNDIMSTIRIKDDTSLYPNNANLFPVLSHYINCFESILPLIIEGIKWSKKEHYYLFTEILKRISSPPKSPPGRSYEDTVKLQYFPSLLALYSIGISALKEQNYILLNMCFNLKMDESDSEYSERIFLIDKVHPCMIESKLMNSILSMNLLTPTSTFLCQTLKKYFINGSFSEKEFEDLFDVFEYFLSLNYYYLVEPKWKNDWAPWGQFQWRNFYSSRGRTNLLASMLTESEKLHQNWLPIKQGMFDGSYENFSDTKTKLTEFLKKIYLH
jgi:hypothetical protein